MDRNEAQHHDLPDDNEATAHPKVRLTFIWDPTPTSLLLLSNTLLVWRSTVRNRSVSEAMTARGAGPHAPLPIVAHYLDQEIELGRLSALDTDALARLVTGAALHEASLATYARESILVPGGLAQRLVAVLAVDKSPEASSGNDHARWR